MMRLELNRFLFVSAVLGVSVSLASACTTKSENTPTHEGGVSGAGGTGGSAGQGSGGSAGMSGSAGQAGSGGAAGQGGSAGAAGSAGQGGTAGVSGSGGTSGTAGASGASGAAGSDAGTCFGDTPVLPDGGGPDCTALQFYGTTCSNGDGGTSEPTGPYYCDYMQKHGRAGVFDEFFLCLFNNTSSATDGCSQAYDNIVQGCIDTYFPEACMAPPYTYDGGSVSCADVAAACPAGDGSTTGLTEQQCNDTINAFNDSTRTDIYYCFSNQSPGTGDCATDFQTCVFNIDAYSGSAANDGG